MPKDTHPPCLVMCQPLRKRGAECKMMGVGEGWVLLSSTLPLSPHPPFSFQGMGGREVKASGQAVLGAPCHRSAALGDHFSWPYGWAGPWLKITAVSHCCLPVRHRLPKSLPQPLSWEEGCFPTKCIIPRLPGLLSCHWNPLLLLSSLECQFFCLLCS